jgi:creatinine amidohydrolase
MRWEELTTVNFKKAVKKSKGVCIVTLAVIEKHGDHLPLGTDMFNVYSLACSAAEKEPAVVFPQYYFTQILEAKHQPGTIAIKYQLMFDLLCNVCEEISRNGLKKIILLNGHGGNTSFIPYFVHAMLEKKEDYMVYFPKDIPSFNGYPEYRKLYNRIMKTKGGHGGECETSITLANRSDLVKMEDIAKPGIRLERLKHLSDLYTPMNWYANYPDHYAGDARAASINKGKKLIELQVKYLVRIIRAVKCDTITKKLYEEFFSRV